jgi:diguanylate cyclase (GGDEF)-like protein
MAEMPDGYLDGALLTAALESMPHGFCVWDDELRLVLWNDRYLKVYGFPREHVYRGMSLREICALAVGLGHHPGATVTDVYNEYSAFLALHDEPGVVAVRESLQASRIIKKTFMRSPGVGWVVTHDDITEERRNEEQVRYLARHDMLTELPNRLLFREYMDAAESRIKRGETIAILCIDLDHFKAANDSLGHGGGDAVLKEVGNRLRASCREVDIVARLGGDEFAVMVGPLQQAVDAVPLAKRIVKVMSEPFQIEDRSITIGASIGIAVAPVDAKTADDLLKNADLALYRAKGEGRSTYHFFEPAMDAALQERRAIEAGLRQAMASGDLRLVFQPFLSLPEGRICGFEALLRWYDRERGMIPPSRFVPIAEESALIVPLGEWVLQEACKAAASWPDRVRVSVNLSPVQFRSRNLVSHVASALESSSLSPERLELEVTESVLSAGNDLTLESLHRLRLLGVRITMDNFGTGYSSLSYLRAFPFDKIKIDRSFVHELSKTRDSLAVVRAVIDFGKSLGIATGAEGVETETQLDIVREHGVTEAQGFLFSPPLPANAVRRLFGDEAKRSNAVVGLQNAS